jgi:hypothetical protein
MLEKAELVAVVEVQKDGVFTCPVKIVETLKGTSPDTFQLCGYNDPQMEAEGVKSETLHKGDRVLVFLSAVKGPSTLEMNEKDFEALKKDVKWFKTPTPTTGDLTIRDGKIRGGCYFNSWPLGSPPVDAAVVTELVRGAVQQREGKQPDAARAQIKEKLTDKFLKGITADKEPANASAAWLAHWLLWAAGDYGGAEADVVLQAAASPHTWVQITAGRALRKLPPDEKTLAAAASLLKSKHSYAQAEGIRVLTGAPFDRTAAVAALVAALPGSSSAARSPQNLMDPVLNVDQSGRELMIRAVAHFKAEKEAEDALTALIADKGLSAGVFNALRDHFLKYRSDKARDRFLDLFRRCPPESAGVFITYLAAEGSEPSRKAITAKLLDPALADHRRGDAILILKDQGLPPEFVLKTVQSVATKYPKDEGAAESSIKVLLSLKDAAATALAAKRLTEGPLKEFSLDSAAGTFARTAVIEPAKLRDVLKAVLTKQAKAGEGESNSNTTAAACIMVADKDLLAFVEKLPKGIFDKGMRDIVLAGMRLKTKPPATPEAALTAWCELLKKEAEFGYATPFLLTEIKLTAGTTLKERALQELHKLIPDPQEEVQAFIDELSAKPAPAPKEGGN